MGFWLTDEGTRGPRMQNAAPTALACQDVDIPLLVTDQGGEGKPSQVCRDR